MANRALVLLDTLLTFLKQQGSRLATCPATYRGGNPSQVLEVDGETVHIHLRESYHQRERTAEEQAKDRRKGDLFPYRYKYFPKGELVLTIENSKYSCSTSWKDGRKKLEEQLEEIVRTLASLPAQVKAKHKAREEAELLRRQEETKRWEIQRKIEARKQFLKKLSDEAKQYQDYTALLIYLDHLASLADSVDSAKKESFLETLDHARRMAAELDPTAHRVEFTVINGLAIRS